MEQTRLSSSQSPAEGRLNRNTALLIVGDIIAFLVFAAIGRRSHGEAAGFDALVAVFTTAAPFLLGWFAVAPWLGAFKTGDGTTTNVGRMVGRTALAWLAALPVGLLLRALFLWREIPLSFAIVTLLTNAAILCGWRAAFAWWAGRSAR
ncbi:MAG: DUF3054 domain-containing protein [Chloroflexaceae bacterium]|jgi:hypothetical protein|nr:DUF3054 domain-containing protein [Chloroflexaceae bacterium]